MELEWRGVAMWYPWTTLVLTLRWLVDCLQLVLRALCCSRRRSISIAESSAPLAGDERAETATVAARLEEGKRARRKRKKSKRVVQQTQEIASENCATGRSDDEARICDDPCTSASVCECHQRDDVKKPEPKMGKWKQRTGRRRH